jgi:hypothetical protein
MLTGGNGEADSKYDIVAIRGNLLSQIGRIQAINPGFVGLRLMSGLAYQGYNRSDACAYDDGMPFGGTGSSTQGCNVFAGHWLYKAGTKLTSTVNASATSLRVQNANSFVVGEYVVIYDAPARSFNNAEHARITAVSKSTNTLTVARGYKSKAASHSTGAIVAAHVLGQGTNKLLWAWNQSSACPKDANGKQLNQVLADWLATNYDKDGAGKPLNGKIDGVLFDADFHYLEVSGGKEADVDNDLVMDEGISPSGVNLWGDGMEAFYARVRNRLPDILIVGGVGTSRGYLSNNGTQFEGFPARPPHEAVNPDYDDVNWALSVFSNQMNHGVEAPRYVETMFKGPTRLYPLGVSPRPGSNATFRFSFGMSLLEGGAFGQHRGNIADPWFDEYAVDVVRGSATFGQAIPSNPNNESQVRRHRHWLGWPQGPRYRLYDAAAFAPKNSLLDGGDFDANLQGWSGDNVNVTRDTAAANRMDGAGALRASNQVRYSSDYFGARINGPRVSVTKGKEYTLVFSAKAGSHRVIQAAVGGESEKFAIPDTWVRRVMTFTAQSTASQNVFFLVGRDDTPVWIDSVYLFEGNANIFRRDFDGGIVVVNATERARTVDLGETFQRIKGTGQDPINNGQRLRSVTIDPWDAAFLVRIP